MVLENIHAVLSKASPYSWPQSRQGQPLWRMNNFASYAEEGYAQNSLIYSAITYKARASLAAPLRAYTGDVDHPTVLPPEHALSQLLVRPNPYQSGAQLMMQNTVYLNLDGNAFIAIDRGPRGVGTPQRMYSLRPDRVFVIPGERGTLLGYLYIPEGKTREDGVPYLPDELMHVKFPNPMDPLEGLGYGLSPISGAARSGDVDNQVTTYLKTFFDRGTMLNVVLKFNMPLTDEEMAEKRRKFAALYGGASQWSKPGVLDDAGDIQQLGQTFDQMGFGPIDERNETRILGPLGVPPILIGARYGLSRSTYTNYPEARRAFWEDTFVPELSLYETPFDYFLAPGRDVNIRFDTSQVPALRQDINKQIDGAYKLFTMGVPSNLAVQAVGLTIENIPGGDEGYLPLNFIPVGSKPAPNQAVGGQGAVDQPTDGSGQLPADAGQQVPPKLREPLRLQDRTRSRQSLSVDVPDPSHSRFLEPGDAASS